MHRQQPLVSGCFYLCFEAHEKQTPSLQAQPRVDVFVVFRSENDICLVLNLMFVTAVL